MRCCIDCARALRGVCWLSRMCQRRFAFALLNNLVIIIFYLYLFRLYLFTRLARPVQNAFLQICLAWLVVVFFLLLMCMNHPDTTQWCCRHLCLINAIRFRFFFLEQEHGLPFILRNGNKTSTLKVCGWGSFFLFFPLSVCLCKRRSANPPHWNQSCTFIYFILFVFKACFLKGKKALLRLALN